MLCTLIHLLIIVVQISKKTLPDIVKHLMLHMDQSEGTSELLIIMTFIHLVSCVLWGCILFSWPVVETKLECAISNAILDVRFTWNYINIAFRNLSIGHWILPNTRSVA